MKIDNKEAQSGSLEDDWDFLPPKKINDPDAKKPDDWVDNPKMDDPEDTKPEVSSKLFAVICISYACVCVRACVRACVSVCNLSKCIFLGLGQARIHS